MTTQCEEFSGLTNLYCEERLSDEQFVRFEELLRSSAECQSLFVEFIQLHGQLAWDAGLKAGEQLESMDCESSLIQECDLCVSASLSERSSRSRDSSGTRRLMHWPMIAASACLVVAVLIGMMFRNPSVRPQLVEHTSSEPKTGNPPDADAAIPAVAEVAAVNQLPPLKLKAIRNENAVVQHEEPLTPLPHDPPQGTTGTSLVDSDVVAEIDRLIHVGWEENNVPPAAEADDHEWVRRVYLTLTGRIPSIEEVSRFIDTKSPRKRDLLLDRLLTDHQTAENLAVIWSNLLIGRSNARGVDQESLFGFLVKQFRENRPWMETVGQLVAAEGRSDENGATNFLLAHLNDQATPATAVTARLFLGQQVHCTQCHDHPFTKERHQEEFWSLNAFFKQAESKPITIAEKDGSKHVVWTLADSGQPGMTFFDNLRGQKKAVLPKYGDESLLAEDSKPRRAELVRLFASDHEHQVARAMINRMWAQFFGFGFTNPIDDIGAHNPVSHPELFEHLTNAFVQSDYDIRRLMRWMSMSQAFRLSSVQSADAYTLDDPQEGGTPLFSRAYPRHMGPEQVYESIRIAIRSVSDQPVDSSLGTDHRREWVEQFVRSYGTDENDEQLEFGGNISQALLMMNGADLENAISLVALQVTKSLHEGAVGQAPLRLALATLNREPTENESKAFRNRYRALARSLPPNEAIRTATEDMLWAYLNSSEFVSVH